MVNERENTNKLFYIIRLVKSYFLYARIFYWGHSLFGWRTSSAAVYVPKEINYIEWEHEDLEKLPEIVQLKLKATPGCEMALKVRYAKS